MNVTMFMLKKWDQVIFLNVKRNYNFLKNFIKMPKSVEFKGLFELFYDVF